MKEIDKEKGVTALLSLAALSQVNDLFKILLYVYLLSDWDYGIYWEMYGN